MADTTSTTSQSRAAAIAVAVIVLGGVMAGVIVPNLKAAGNVEYGAWGPDIAGTATQRRCVEGTVWINDDLRHLGNLPLIANGSPPYCTYRACYDPGDTQVTAFMEAGIPVGMDPLIAEVERPWQEPWPPLSVWCGGQDTAQPAGCACRPRADVAGACEAFQQGIDEAVGSWRPAPPGITLNRDQWRGACERAPCVVLAGRDYFPPACCVPRCAGRACGPDACGGSCGACADPLVCDGGTGQCVEPAPPLTP